jgi:hypothetical protein
MEIDSKGYIISSFEIIELMSKDKKNPIKQILYIGNLQKFNIFEHLNQLDKVNLMEYRFIPFEKEVVQPSYLYAFIDAIIVVSDDIDILVTNRDHDILNATRSQIVKEKDFPYLWFQDYWERTFKKEKDKITNRFELMELD